MLTTEHLYIWGGTTKSQLTKINKSIKNSMQIMLLKEKHDPVKPFYEYHP